MNLQQILQHKGSTVFKARPSDSLAEVIAQLVQHNCGSLVVCEGDRMIGIITERDILRACAAGASSFGEQLVERCMSRKVVTGAPQDEVETVMGLMTENRIRHLPVLENGRLVGLISIGDVVKAHHDSLCLENHYLKSYLQG